MIKDARTSSGIVLRWFMHDARKLTSIFPLQDLYSNNIRMNHIVLPLTLFFVYIIPFLATKKVGGTGYSVNRFRSAEVVRHYAVVSAKQIKMVTETLLQVKKLFSSCVDWRN